jgi:hypothetical protein
MRGEANAGVVVVCTACHKKKSEGVIAFTFGAVSGKISKRLH